MTTYEGWGCYETWAVNLWIANEEGAYRYWRDLVAVALDHHGYADAESDDERAKARDEAMRGVAAMLEAEYEEGMPVVEGVYRDLLTTALQAVNWHEIAASMVDEMVVELEAKP